MCNKDFGLGFGLPFEIFAQSGKHLRTGLRKRGETCLVRKQILLRGKQAINSNIMLSVVSLRYSVRNARGHVPCRLRMGLGPCLACYYVLALFTSPVATQERHVQDVVIETTPQFSTASKQAAARPRRSLCCRAARAHGPFPQAGALAPRWYSFGISSTVTNACAGSNSTAWHCCTVQACMAAPTCRTHTDGAFAKLPELLATGATEREPELLQTPRTAA